MDIRPQLGDLLFSDDFSDPDKWATGRSPAGSIAVSLNELTLAVSQERGYLSTIRSGSTLADFYTEITASPSLCRGSDEYGLLLRVSASEDFYRFSLSCNGEARLDRFLNGRASSPQPWLMSGAIPPGAPSSSRLAVAATGKELRFFVNGEYLFTVSDSSIPSGSLGVFARAASDTPVTVNFTDLEVYRIAR